MIAFLLVACVPDDWNGKPYQPDTASTVDTAPVGDGTGLVGKWLSQGADLSTLFAADPFNYTKVTVTFRSDLGYTASVVDKDSKTGTVTGTYSADDGTSPSTIALTQTTPYDALASGLYSVDGDVLTYEVVQTSPDYGYTPPTPKGGFGSTSGPSIQPGDNVQTYRRQ